MNEHPSLFATIMQRLSYRNKNKVIRIGPYKAHKINPQNISKCKSKRKYEKTQPLRISKHPTITRFGNKFLQKAIFLSRVLADRTIATLIKLSWNKWNPGGEHHWITLNCLAKKFSDDRTGCAFSNLRLLRSIEKGESNALTQVAVTQCHSLFRVLLPSAHINLKRSFKVVRDGKFTLCFFPFLF